MAATRAAKWDTTAMWVRAARATTTAAWAAVPSCAGERPRTTAEADDDVSGNEATTRMATEERGLGSATEGGGRVERARGWFQVGPRAK